MGWHWHLSFSKYGEAWRQGRKLLDHSFRGAAAAYRPMQQARARVLLTRLLATPNEWQDHVELCEIAFSVSCYDISIHDTSVQFPRRTYFGDGVRI